MRKLLLFCCVLPSGLLFAQNWALINPDYKYNYSNDGTDTISNQVFVMETQGLGLDSIRYVMDPVAKRCSDCSGLSNPCNTSPGMITGQPQVFGLTAIVSGSDWTLFGSDTLRVLPHAALGASWSTPSGMECTMTSVTELPLFGQPDSVKVISFSNGSSMAISKTYGIISYATPDGQIDLIGVQGGLEVGAYFPVIPDFFNYQPGDILQYRSTGSWSNGICTQNSIRTKKYEILSRTEMQNRTDYTMHVVVNDQTWSYPIFGGGPCDGSHTTGTFEEVLGIEHDHWTEDNFLGNNFLDHLWPKAFAAPLANGGFPGEFGSEYEGVLWTTRIDDQGRYIMETSAALPGQFGDQPVYVPCFGDSVFWPLGEDQLTSRFVEGIGFTFGKYFLFEHDGETVLEGYRIGDEEFGTITPDDVLLAVNAEEMVDQRIFPNPASDHLQLTSVTPGTVCTILNPTGQVLLMHTISSSTERIDVSGLSPGFYLLEMAGFRPHRFVIAR